MLRDELNVPKRYRYGPVHRARRHDASEPLFPITASRDVDKTKRKNRAQLQRTRIPTT